MTAVVFLLYSMSGFSVMLSAMTCVLYRIETSECGCAELRTAVCSSRDSQHLSETCSE